MALSEEQIESGQEVVRMLEISLRKLKGELLRKGAAEVPFLRMAPLRGSYEVPKSLELLIPSSKEEALEWATQCLTSTRRITDQNPKESLRCFGAIKVSDDVMDFAQSVNSHKAKLKKFIDAIKPRNRQYLYRSIEGFHAVQALRLIEFVNGEKKVTYRWHNAIGVTQITKGELIDQMLKDLSLSIGSKVEESHVTMHTGNSQIYKVAKDIEALVEVKDRDEVLAISRVIMPHVRGYFSGSKRRVTAAAPPLSITDIDVDGESLNDYSKCFEESDEKNARVSVIEKEPLIDHLNVHRYIETKRTTIKKNVEKPKSRMRGGVYLEI